MRLHPSNPTPGQLMDNNQIKEPIDQRELVEVIDLILSGISGPQSYYLQAAKERLKQIKKKL